MALFVKVDRAIAGSARRITTRTRRPGSSGVTRVLPVPCTRRARADAPADLVSLRSSGCSSLLKDKEKLKGVLLFHVLTGSYSSAAVHKMHDGDKVKTVSGKEFTLGLKNNEVTVNGAHVSKTDIQASNGVFTPSTP